MTTILTKGQVHLPIDREIRVRLEDGRADSFLLIVPTGPARLKWQRECLAYAPNGAAAGLHIHTLENLVQRFYRRIGIGRRQVSAGLQTVWMRQIMDRLELTFFRPHAEIPIPQGTVARLTSAINQLKASGIDPSRLQEDLIVLETRSSAGVEETGSDKLADLITIYEAYEQRLGRQWTDRGGIHRAVSNHLSRSPSQMEKLMIAIFPGVDLVIVSGFDVFSPPDLSILTSVADLPQIRMGIVLDFDEQNESLFGHVKESYDQLLNCGFREIAESTKRTNVLNQYFARNLFRKDRWLQPSVDRRDLTEHVTILQVSDRGQEVEQIARLIKQIVSERPDFNLCRLCITFYDLNIYAPLIREIFPLYGIPYALDWGESLANSPLVVSIFSLLDLINGNASLRNKHKVRHSPYFHFDEEIDEVIDECQFSTGTSPEVFRQSFDSLMETLKVRQQILNHGKDSSHHTQSLMIAEEIAAYRQFRTCVDELVDFFILENGSERHYQLGAYINWLRLMASQTNVETQHSTSLHHTGGVWALPLVQTKELDFDVVILGGLVDGEFPAIFRPDAFLHPRRSRTESNRLREDRFLFYQALKLFREHLYLVVPERDGEIEIVQSSFIDELRRIAEMKDLEDDNDTFFSTEHFLKNYGKFTWEHTNEGVEGEAEGKDGLLALPPAFLRVLDLIDHNVCVEKSRTVTHDLPQYEGWLIHDLLSSTSQRGLEKQREGVYSISRLESYGRCPFQYFSHYILKLNSIEKIEEGLTNLEKGNLLHTILFEFYDRRRDKPPISACTDSEFGVAAEALKQIAQKHLRQTQHGGLFWEIDVETLIGGHGRTGVLPTFLEAERTRKFEVQPRYFEVGFGSGGREGQTDLTLGSIRPITVGEVALDGKIDRIEVGDELFIVGDYKTGRNNPKIRDILEGRSLQLPVYIAVVEQLLRGHHPTGMKGAGGVYYVLREDSKADLGIGDREYAGRAFQTSSRSGQLLPNPGQGVGSIQKVIDLAIEYTNRYVRSIASGEFPLTPHDKQLVCHFCSFKKICRVGVISEETASVDGTAAHVQS